MSLRRRLPDREVKMARQGEGEEEDDHGEHEERPQRERSHAPARTRRLAPRSDRALAAVDEHRDVRLHLFARDGGHCLIPLLVPRGTVRVPALDDRWPFLMMEPGIEAVLVDPGPCGGPWTPHHVEKAQRGGGYTLDNLLTLCARHNTWVEDRPVPASCLGLVVSRDVTHAAALARRLAIPHLSNP